MPDAKKREEKKESGSKISNLEWGMVISLLAIVDTIQIGLDLLAQVGVLVNRFIDIVVAMAWPTYLKLRGVKLNAPRVISIIAAFFFEEIPDVDALPFWTADGIVMLASIKAEEKIKEETGIDVGAIASGAEGESEEPAAAPQGGAVGGGGGAVAGEGGEGAGEGGEEGEEKDEDAEKEKEKEKEEGEEGEGEYKGLTQVSGRPCVTEDGRPGVWVKDPNNPRALICESTEKGDGKKPGTKKEGPGFGGGQGRRAEGTTGGGGRKSSGARETGGDRSKTKNLLTFPT